MRKYFEIWCSSSLGVSLKSTYRMHTNVSQAQLQITHTPLQRLPFSHTSNYRVMWVRNLDRFQAKSHRRQFVTVTQCSPSTVCKRRRTIYFSQIKSKSVFSQNARFTWYLLLTESSSRLFRRHGWEAGYVTELVLTGGN